MATIPRAALDYLTQQINGISAEAQSKVLRVLQQINWTPENIAQCRDVVLEALALVMPTYTGMAAQASADFYDASRELALGERLGAVSISGYDPRKTEGAVRGFVRFVLDGRVETFNEQVLQRIDYEMKRSAGESMFANGRRDPRRPKFARVPTGSETCDFCLMLASRGFVYSSEATAGAVKLDHYHAGCVLPDTVLGAVGVKSLLRRKFEGDVIDITTRGGRHLSVTANHPILTVNGWVKAGMLHDGDALLCGFAGKGHDFGVPSVDDRPPSAEQVFEALRLLDAAYPVGVEVSSVDFDGESVSNSDVEVIDVNRLLEGHIVPVGHESFGDKSFSVGALFERCKRLNGAGAANFGDGTRSLPSCGVMRGLGLSCPILRGHLGGADETGLGVAAPMDTSVVEPTVNDMPGDAVSLGQLQDALSALVSLDEIGRCGDAARAYLDSIAFENSEGLLVRDAKIFGNSFGALPSGIEIDYVSVADTRHFVGHVYNLSADGHWYTANGIITHNCDCRIVASFDADTVEGYDPDDLYLKWRDREAWEKKHRSAEHEPFRRIVGEHSIADDLKATNPHYREGRQWQINCQRCVGAYEMRRRGYDVTVRPRPMIDGAPDYSDELPNRLSDNGWPHMFENPELEAIAGTTGNAIRNRISQRLREYGDGARVIVRVRWKGRNSGGHVFIAEQDGGETRYIDPQTGSSDCSSYLDRVRKGETYILRVDDNETTSLIEKAVEDK